MLPHFCFIFGWKNHSKFRSHLRDCKLSLLSFCFGRLRRIFVRIIFDMYLITACKYFLIRVKSLFCTKNQKTWGTFVHVLGNKITVSHIHKLYILCMICGLLRRDSVGLCLQQQWAETDLSVSKDIYNLMIWQPDFREVKAISWPQ